VKILAVSLAVLVGVLVLTVVLLSRRLEALSDKEKKRLVKKTINDVFTWFEARGWLPRTPAFQRDYLRDYPSLRRLEEGFPAVREECLALLEVKDRLTDMSAMGGRYTEAGIHTAKWKTFMFKSGRFVEENCRLAPRTAALIAQVPGVYTAFFSVLDPRQRIPPHWGYYKGFLRYHLGVVVPNDNEDESCYLRVNADPHDNALRDPSFAEKGEVYYWHEGEGIVFDDNYLHDAVNRSGEARVVLWLDLRRRMPWPLQLFNRFCLWVAHRDSSVKRIRRNAVVTLDAPTEPAEGPR
jgi:aspartyl/asparaginyl beta-hydroxylase (cupin superfamily)